VRIGLVQVDGKIPNLALMKVSAFYKAQGCRVEFASPLEKYDKVYIATVFTWNRSQAEFLAGRFDCDVEVGGTGWDIGKTLSDEIERCRPDYDLYSVEDILKMNHSGSARGVKTKANHIKNCTEIATMGIGFSSRGCVRKCGFCFVPQKEGALRQGTPIGEIVNPRSNLIMLLDNNLTADPFCVEKLVEIKERGLVLSLCQGLDIRLMTADKAKALGEVKHHKRLHYSWDSVKDEAEIWKGIEILSEFVRPYKQMCYVLCGFDSTFEEDMYRVRKLLEYGISPYVMVFNNRRDDIRLNHFKDWVNRRTCQAVDFEGYKPYQKWRDEGAGSLFV
jgi:hypothetical protein